MPLIDGFLDDVVEWSLAKFKRFMERRRVASLGVVVDLTQYLGLFLREEAHSNELEGVFLSHDLLANLGDIPKRVDGETADIVRVLAVGCDQIQALVHVVGMVAIRFIQQHHYITRAIKQPLYQCLVEQDVGVDEEEPVGHCRFSTEKENQNVGGRCST